MRKHALDVHAARISLLLQVFKFCTYLSIPICMTLVISQSPRNLETLIKHVRRSQQRAALPFWTAHLFISLLQMLQCCNAAIIFVAIQ